MLLRVLLTVVFIGLLSSCGQSEQSSIGKNCDVPGELWTINQDQIAICVGGKGGNEIYAEGAVFDEVLLLGNLALFIPGSTKGVDVDSIYDFKKSLGIESFDGDSLDTELLLRVISQDQRWDAIREGLAVVELAQEKLTQVYRTWCPYFSEEEPYCLPKELEEPGIEQFFFLDDAANKAREDLYPKLKVLEIDLKERYLVDDVAPLIELYLTKFAEEKDVNSET